MLVPHYIGVKYHVLARHFWIKLWYLLEAIFKKNADEHPCPIPTGESTVVQALMR